MRDINQAFTTFRIIRPASAVRFTHPVIYQTVPVDAHSSESGSEKLFHLSWKKIVFDVAHKTRETSISVKKLLSKLIRLKLLKC